MAWYSCRIARKSVSICHINICILIMRQIATRSFLIGFQTKEDRPCKVLLQWHNAHLSQILSDVNLVLGCWKLDVTNLNCVGATVWNSSEIKWHNKTTNTPSGKRVYEKCRDHYGFIPKVPITMMFSLKFLKIKIKLHNIITFSLIIWKILSWMSLCELFFFSLMYIYCEKFKEI